MGRAFVANDHASATGLRPVPFAVDQGQHLPFKPGDLIGLFGHNVREVIAQTLQMRHAFLGQGKIVHVAHLRPLMQ